MGTAIFYRADNQNQRRIPLRKATSKEATTIALDQTNHRIRSLKGDQ
jgi:hypothetical protein